MADTPQSAPRRTPMKKRKDSRPTITLKGDEFGPEFRTLINKAASRAGSTQSSWIAETLTKEAQRILKGLPDPADAEPAQPVAVVTERLEDQDKRISELADQVRRLSDLQQRTLWQRLRGAFVQN